MNGNFDAFPSIDHLKEGVHYTLVNFDFASTPLVSHTPGTPCPQGFKMIFGMCRKLKGDNQDWDKESETDEEKSVKQEGARTGSTYDTNKQMTVGGKKYGWAKLGGKPVIVEWGSVAGVRNPDGSITKTTRDDKGVATSSTAA
jgi:hypothetical protein